MSNDDILSDAEERMEKAVAVARDAFAGLRTGRATPGLVDSVRVEYHGSPTPLKQLANVSVPEPQQIVIRPYDPSIVSDVAKAIQNANLNLAPNIDRQFIRLNVPPLTGDRRKQLVGRVNEIAEQARISIRNIRRDANKAADQAEKAKEFSEDDTKRVKDDVQELTKTYEGKVDEAASAKEKDILDE